MVILGQKFEIFRFHSGNGRRGYGKDDYYEVRAVETIKCKDAEEAKKLNSAFNKAYREVIHPTERNRSGARQKGLDFERSVCAKLKHIFPAVKRHLEFQASACTGVDLDNTGRFKIQCKKWKTYSSVNVIEETDYEPAFGEIPLLITEADGKPAMVVLPLTDFIDLISGKDNLY